VTPDELDRLEKRLLLSGPVNEASLTAAAIRPLIAEVRQSWAARDLAVAEAIRCRKAFSAPRGAGCPFPGKGPCPRGCPHLLPPRCTLPEVAP
jgi:hypothetical protein